MKRKTKHTAMVAPAEKFNCRCALLSVATTSASTGLVLSAMG